MIFDDPNHPIHDCIQVVLVCIVAAACFFGVVILMAGFR